MKNLAIGFWLIVAGIMVAVVIGDFTRTPLERSQSVQQRVDQPRPQIVADPGVPHPSPSNSARTDLSHASEAPAQAQPAHASERFIRGAMMCPTKEALVAISQKLVDGELHNPIDYLQGYCQMVTPDLRATVLERGANNIWRVRVLFPATGRTGTFYTWSFGLVGHEKPLT